MASGVSTEISLPFHLRALTLALPAMVFVRSSVLPGLIPGLESGLTMGVYAFYVLLFLWAACTGRLVKPTVVLLLACLPGTLLSESWRSAVFRACGFFALVGAVGPLTHSSVVAAVRNRMWTNAMAATIAIGVFSAAWKLFSLPNLGRGAFTGLMNHSMILAPIAATAALAAGCRWVRTQRLLDLALALICGVPLLLSGSRAAVASCLVAGVVVLILTRRRMRYFLPIAFTSIAIAGWLFVSALQHTDAYEDSVLGALAKKGTNNTREELWKARIADFRSRPIIGLGVGIAHGAGSPDQTGDKEKGRTEPGSGYLTILSMTGLCGACGFIIFIANLADRWAWRLRLLPPWKQAELASVGVFLACHAIFEGWVLAVGSPIAFLFWLWTGHLSDSLTTCEGTERKYSQSQGGDNWTSIRDR